MRLRRKSVLALFPERRLFFMVVCLGGIMGFYLLSILPHQQAADQMEHQIDALKKQIDEQPLFRQLADQNQLRARRIGSDLNSMISETGELKLSLEMMGTFSNLRAFMLKLGELPYLTHVERIVIRRESGVQGLLMELDIWLARQS